MLSSQEIKDAGENIVKHCVYWCAKEAMYKIYGKRGLHFESQLNLDPFRLQSFGELRGYINADNLTSEISLGYTVQSDYVMVYTKFY